MIIQDLLLHNQNEFLIDGVSLGKRLAEKGKLHLWEERKESVIDVIVLHYISAVMVAPDEPYNLEKIIDIFCEYGVSSHFLINRQGEIFRLVPENMKAWHCGGSIMPPPDCRQFVNEFSIGIELMATETSGFTEEQMRSAVLLSHHLEKKYSRRFTYVGHEDIAGPEAVRLGLRHNIKPDPGELFDWIGFENTLILARQEGIVA